jgi:hypothetical protein
MRGLWGRLAAMGLVLLGALALTVPVALADSRVPSNSAQVGPLQVRIFSQMCDGFGGQLHTRLNIANTSSSSQRVVVQDPFSKIVYDPSNVVSAGKGMLVHLTSSPATPPHDVTVLADGATGTVRVQQSPCTTTSSSSSSSSTSSSSTTSTTRGTTGSTTPTTAPFDPGGGGPVTGPGSVSASGGGVSPASTTAVKAASSGVLPFTGSDMRAFALLGNFLVVIGFVMLLLSHRARRNAAMQLVPAPVRVEPNS